MSDLKKMIIIGLLLTSVVILLLLTSESIRMPDVYMSRSTDECTKVITYDGKIHSCSDLPELYNLTWVK